MTKMTYVEYIYIKNLANRRRKALLWQTTLGVLKAIISHIVGGGVRDIDEGL